MVTVHTLYGPTPPSMKFLEKLMSSTKAINKYLLVIMFYLFSVDLSTRYVNVKIFVSLNCDS